MTNAAKQRNIRLDLSYDGKDFLGYQFQPHGRTVQGTLNEAWKVLTGEDDELIACSRLDAGVHANQFVLNIPTNTKEDCERIVRGLNGILFHNLQASISIYSAQDVAAHFHSRFDAVGKHYRYLLWYGFGTHALLCPRAWIVKTREPLENLGPILKKFEGSHDFSAFRAQDCSAKTTTRTINKIDVWTHPRFPELTVIDVWGEGFLKNMIRNIVGTAVEVATLKKPIEAIDEAFKHCNRSVMGQCAPAPALRLEQVFYDKQIYLDAFQKLARDLTPN